MVKDKKLGLFPLEGDEPWTPRCQSCRTRTSLSECACGLMLCGGCMSNYGRGRWEAVNSLEAALKFERIKMRKVGECENAYSESNVVIFKNGDKVYSYYFKSFQ